MLVTFFKKAKYITCLLPVKIVSFFNEFRLLVFRPYSKIQAFSAGGILYTNMIITRYSLTFSFYYVSLNCDFQSPMSHSSNPIRGFSNFTILNFLLLVFFHYYNYDLYNFVLV